MIVETGYSTWDEPRAEQVMRDLFDKMTQEEGCAGILYWEPEVYGGWNSRYLDDNGVWHEGTGFTYGLKVVNNGAFTAYGQPAPALLAFGGTPRGDLNDDYRVDVTDVSILIDMVLGKAEQDLGHADLDGNSMIDVTDVNALIDIVLGKG